MIRDIRNSIQTHLGTKGFTRRIMVQPINHRNKRHSLELSAVGRARQCFHNHSHYFSQSVGFILSLICQGSSSAIIPVCSFQGSPSQKRTPPSLLLPNPNAWGKLNQLFPGEQTPTELPQPMQAHQCTMESFCKGENYYTMRMHYLHVRSKSKQFYRLVLVNF